ncbi:hypothetical protein ACEQPO_14630 [Bacillus sp. SL00103]
MQSFTTACFNKGCEKNRLKAFLIRLAPSMARWNSLTDGGSKSKTISAGGSYPCFKRNVKFHCQLIAEPKKRLRIITANCKQYHQLDRSTYNQLQSRCDFLIKEFIPSTMRNNLKSAVFSRKRARDRGSGLSQIK